MTSPSTDPVDSPAPASVPAQAQPTPPTLPTRASVAEILPTDQFSQYLLHSKGEMFPVLRGLIEQVSLITMMFNEGRDMVLTSLISCGDDGLILDFGASKEMNSLALKAEKLFCVTQLGKVKIQFILRGVSEVEADGRPAFFAELPDSILRLQRREHFRLSLSVSHPVKCKLSYVNAEGVRVVTEASVADLSGGGVGLTGLPLELPLDPGMEISGCTIDLSDVGVVSVNMRLSRVIETTSRSGVHAKRAGCEFVNLPGPMEKLIQRYIMKIERERKARESGLG